MAIPREASAAKTGNPVSEEPFQRFHHASSEVWDGYPAAERDIPQVWRLSVPESGLRWCYGAISEGNRQY